MEIINAKIDSTWLGYEDHGILSAMIIVDYGDGGHQGFGGYSLGGDAMSIFVENTLKVVGVESWEELKDKYVRVKTSEHKIFEIGNITKETWFNPEKSFKK